MDDPAFLAALEASVNRLFSPDPQDLSGSKGQHVRIISVMRPSLVRILDSGKLCCIHHCENRFVSLWCGRVTL
jgi:hypothetical protein